MGNSDVQLTYVSGLTVLVYTIGIIIILILYYRVLQLHVLEDYSGPYSIILICMIATLMLNMAYSVANPPSSSDRGFDEETKVVQRTMNVIAFIFISNIMIREYNRLHTVNSRILQNMMIIITVSLMLNNLILWIPIQDINMLRIMRDIRTVNFTIGLGFMIIFITDIVKRGNENMKPQYL